MNREINRLTDRSGKSNQYHHHQYREGVEGHECVLWSGSAGTNRGYPGKTEDESRIQQKQDYGGRPAEWHEEGSKYPEQEGGAGTLGVLVPIIMIGSAFAIVTLGAKRGTVLLWN